MTLAELLHHTRHAILRDTAQPYLWSDEELVRYFAEGEDKFCRHTHCLVSEDNELTSLVAQQGEAIYALDKPIIHVYQIYKEDGQPLRDLPRARSPHMVTEGAPQAFSKGRGSNKVRLYPTPDKGYQLTMLVAHTPITKLNSSTDLAIQSPSIQEEYHMHLCLYATYKALLNNGPEESNTASAADFYTQWQEALRDAKRDTFKLRTPTNARVVTSWTGARRV